MNQKVFSTRLKEARKNKKIKQHEIASHMGIARTTYANYEIGTKMPKLDKVVKMAEFFGVTTDYLLGNDLVTDESLVKTVVGSDQIIAIPVYKKPYFGQKKKKRSDILDYRYYEAIISLEHPCVVFRLNQNYQLFDLTADDLVLVRIQNFSSDQDLVYVQFDEQEVELRQIFYTPDAIIFTSPEKNIKPEIVHDDDFLNGKVKLIGVVLEIIRTTSKG